jgi:ABC-type transport system substrate-binding protein
MVVTLSSCGSGGGSAASSGSGTAGKGNLTVGDPVALSNSDPIHAISSRDQSYLWTVYDTLLTFTPTQMEPAPGLAESWTQPDPQTLVLHLRSGVTFQDGTPFDAAAVKFNLERDLAPGTTTVGLLGSLASVDATDPTTATLHLKKPDSSLLLALSDLPGMMVSPAAAQKAGNSLSTTPVGAGPYQFVSQVTGSTFVVKRYTGYWNKAYTGPDQIEIKTIGDPATQVNALKSGQITMAINVDPAQLSALKAASNLKVETDPSFEDIPITMNLNKKPLSDPLVRKAISLAVDRDALVSTAEFGAATPAWSILPKQSWAYPAGIAEDTRNVTEAKQLLAQAGYPDGVSFDMIYHPTSTYRRIATLIQSQLAEAGIKVDIVPHDLTNGAPEYLSGQKYDSELASFGGRQDPATAYAALFSSKALLNPGQAVIPGVDDAIAKANSVSSTADRKAALQNLGKIISDGTYSMVLYQRQLIVATSSSVSGYTPNILGKPKFDGISVKG